METSVEKNYTGKLDFYKQYIAYCISCQYFSSKCTQKINIK